MMRWTVRIANCLVWSVVVPLGSAAVERPYTVEAYQVSIRLDMTKQLLYGEADIRLHNRTDTAFSALELDAGALRIVSVAEGQIAQSFERNHNLLFIALTNPLLPDEPRTITLHYQAGPPPGLRFFSDQIYTAQTSDWMPCSEEPGERATLHLTIAAPPDMKAAGSGQLTATRAGEAQTVTEWRLDSPTDPSLFGFVVGSFSENTADSDGAKLRILGAGTQLVEPTTAAMHYLNERTGKHYPGQTYTEAFIHGDLTRSMAGLTLLPESYAQKLEKQADDLWLLTNELARQWYGVGIASGNVSDTWLSDGISAFLGDAFLEERFGKERYEREIEHARQIYDRLRAEGQDRPLSDTERTGAQGGDSRIPEYKGAYFLYLLSQKTGDSAFWNGLRLYTSEEWGRAAASEDFQRAFDAVDTNSGTRGRKNAGAEGKQNRKNSPKTLDGLFDLWVYGVTDTKSKKADGR
jgi:aminopeptidase N